MTKRKLQRARQENIPAPMKTKTISQEALVEIRMLNERAALALAEAEAARTAMRLAVAKKLQEAEMPIQTSALCLDCGTIRPKANVPCPGCQALHRQRPAR